MTYARTELPPLKYLGECAKSVTLLLGYRVRGIDRPGNYARAGPCIYFCTRVERRRKMKETKRRYLYALAHVSEFSGGNYLIGRSERCIIYLKGVGGGEYARRRDRSLRRTARIRHTVRGARGKSARRVNCPISKARGTYEGRRGGDGDTSRARHLCFSYHARARARAALARNVWRVVPRTSGCEGGWWLWLW